MSDARWGAPRESGERDIADERPRVYDERDRDDDDLRHGLMRDLDLPRGEERELVVDRGRGYELNAEDSRTLSGGTHGCLARRRATHRRAIGVAAITRTQIAKTRLQRRQTFWRSGPSTMSKQQRASTGHGAQTVAQERRPARSVEASRRSPRAWSFTSRPSSLSPPQAVSLQQSSHLRGGARRQLLTDIGAVLTAAERLHGSSMTAE